IEVLSPVLCPEKTKTKRFPYSDGQGFGSGADERSYTQELVTIQPNPARDKVFVIINEEVLATRDIQLFNLSGKMLYQISSALNRIELNTENLSAGTYLVKIKTGDNQVIKKMVIMN
ncbi:MAG: T9SS type A sorting domain-containing protein, partial [Bacteroidota bacterium]|nr:T9SS type A sorting domain-containing protein [Bacteroidota bacterium]